MSTPFLAELRIMSFSFAPKGWAMANGQLLPINQNQALFALLGTTYGGDGRVNFGLPNLQGKLPVHQGAGFTLGQVGGEYNHTLTMNEMSQHNHLMNVFATAPIIGATGRFPGSNQPASALQAPTPGTPGQIWGTGTNNITMSPTSIAPVGGSQPHTNTQPFLTLNVCIALQGIFPSQN
jgi:microcystin-dependent protein